MKKAGLLGRLLSRQAASNFKTLDEDALPRGLVTQFKSPHFYTPLVQLKLPSEEFGATMRLLQRKRHIHQEDLRYMAEVLVSEYAKIYNAEQQQQRSASGLPEAPAAGPAPDPSGTYPAPLCAASDAAYLKDYRCEAPDYGGVADYLLYCNQFRNFVPVLYFAEGLHFPGTIAACLWNLARRPGSPHGYALQTDGHAWQLVRVSADMRLEKTCLYEAAGRFGKLYADEYHQQLVLGLLEEGLDLQRVQVRALRKVYDYVDEKRLSQELLPGETDRPSLVSRVLRDKIERRDRKA